MFIFLKENKQKQKEKSYASGFRKKKNPKKLIKIISCPPRKRIMYI